jgi:ribosomal protein S18 acetylase RimI-like enzyme
MTALTLARPDDLDRLLPLVAACHAEVGIVEEDTRRRAALLPVLEGSPHAAAYLIGPPRTPIGYLVISFGWSVIFAGLVGTVDEIYIRPAVRGRGIATEVLSALPRALAGAGLKALHLTLRQEDLKARRLYEKMHFVSRERDILMTLKL